MDEVGPLYPNQPLVEVATEVRFKADLAIEAVRADFQRKIKDKFPVLKVPNAYQGIAPSLQPYRFESECGGFGIQLAINSLSYFSRDYPGQKAFISEVKSATSILFSLLESIEVSRVGWRYINAIPIIRENDSLPLSRYFKENDIFGSLLSRELKELSCRAVKQVGQGSVNIKIENSYPHAGSEEEAILLDIDAFLSIENPIIMRNDEVLSCINEYHDFARATFENLISDNYREFLLGDGHE